jgi:hypothetical protein
MAKALITANSAEYPARANASAVVRDRIAELRECEVRKLLRKLELKSRHLRKSGTLATNGLLLNECHAQNGDAK